MRLNLKYAGAYYGRGAAYADQGEQTKAKEDFDDAVRIVQGEF
jgi:tetratricopeptide (TPR) repeat protein